MYRELLHLVRGRNDDALESRDNSPVTEEAKDPKQRQKWANLDKYVPNMTEVQEDDSELFASTKGPIFKDNNVFTFEINDSNQIDSVQDVHTHLVKELGEDKVNKCYPILRDFGDRILNDENQELLIKALSPYITR